MNFLLETGLKSIGLLALVAVAAWLVRGKSAAVRHRIWALASLGLAALPLLAFQLPEIRVERPATVIEHSVSTSRAPVVAAESVSQPALPTPMPIPEHESTPIWPVLLTLGWAFGAFLLLAQTILQLLYTAGWTRRSEDLSSDPTLGVPPHTRVVRTPNVEVPMTLGFLRPTVLLPESSKGWSADRLRAVLLHEGAHVKRGDWAWLIFGRMVTALYWPNPLAWWAMLRLRTEGELAADDSVLREGVNAPSYAEMLVDMAEGLCGRSMGAALPFVELGSLKARIAAILHGPGQRGPLRRPAAILALLLGIAIVTPYAATHLVPGSSVIRDGLIDLGDGRQAQIVAITDMTDGLNPVSWDIHGALLRRPFPVTRDDMGWFRLEKAVPKSSIVRYVIFRVDENTSLPDFQTSSGEQVDAYPYRGLARPGADFRDALGGSYRVMRLVAPEGSQAATDLSLKIPDGDWKLYAYQGYKKGEEWQMLNPMAGIHIAPMMPSRGKGTEATFVLPPEFSERESTVRFLPGDPGNTRLRGMTGPLTASTSQLPEQVSRVEILSRSLRSVVLAKVPLVPDLSAKHVLYRFLPDVSYTASHGVAELPEQTSIAIKDICRPITDRRAIDFDAEGKLVKKIGWPWVRYYNFPTTPASNSIGIAVEKRQRQPAGLRPLYDDEGFPVATSLTTYVSEDSDLATYSTQIERGSGPIDLTTQVALGRYRMVARIRPQGMKGAFRGDSNSRSDSYSVRVAFSPSIAREIQGKDVEIRALDAKGEMVMLPDKSQASRIESNYVDFFFPQDIAKRVKLVEIKIRPYAWVRFPHIAVDAG